MVDPDARISIHDCWRLQWYATTLSNNEDYQITQTWRDVIFIREVSVVEGDGVVDDGCVEDPDKRGEVLFAGATLFAAGE